MKHWAAPLIGRPWRENADGPDAFYCWGLVRYCLWLRLQVRAPLLRDGFVTEDIKRAADDLGWRLVTGPMQEDDVVMMTRLDGRRHVGFAVRGNGRLGVLHANGHQTETGPVGCVEFQTLQEIRMEGYGNFEFWRRA